MNSYLQHFGIPGQKWGVRRFQNEDGTLTPEGKARYYDSLSDEQKKAYNMLTPKDKIRFNKKFVEGKDFHKASKEILSESARKVALTNLAVSVAFLYLSPFTRGMMKEGTRYIAKQGKNLFKAAANSNVAKRGSLWLKKMAKRRSMVKDGAFVVNKHDFSVRDIPFGGYLRS